MKRTIWIGILLLCIGIGKVRAQNDPVLAGMILLYTDKAEKELKNQEKVMLIQTTGHLWTKEEVKATTDLQRGVQQLFGLFPVDNLLRSADIRFLPRNIKADGQYGRLYQTGKPQ